MMVKGPGVFTGVFPFLGKPHAEEFIDLKVQDFLFALL